MGCGYVRVCVLLVIVLWMWLIVFMVLMVFVVRQLRYGGGAWIAYGLARNVPSMHHPPQVCIVAPRRLPMSFSNYGRIGRYLARVGRGTLQEELCEQLFYDQALDRRHDEET